MGGFVGGRLATRLARPLVACGVAEALVGITAFATPFVLEALTRVWVSVHAELPDSLFALTVIRFIVAFLVLIVPTSHDGRHPAGHHQVRVAREERGGGKIGLLYAINTTGAIVGALVAGFYFISEVGVADSFEIAAAANVAIGLIAIFAAFSRGPVPDPYSMPAAPAATAETAGPANHLALWVFFISGLLLLALEIIWLRMLAVFLRPTAYAFTILLACVFPMKPGHAKRIYIAGPEEMKAFVGDR